MSQRNRLANADYDALLEAWLGDETEVARPERAAAIIEAAAARGDDRLALASEFVESIVDDIERVAESTAAFKRERAEDLYRRALECDWPRFDATVEARMLFWQAIEFADDSWRYLPTIEARIAEAPDDIAAADRWWLVHSVAVIHSYLRNTHECVTAGLVDSAVARETGFALYETESAICLSYIFLHVGDFEGALEPIKTGLEVSNRSGRRCLLLRYNALCAFVQSGDNVSARQLLDESPDLIDDFPRLHGSVRGLVALLLAREGRIENALAAANEPIGDLLPSEHRTRSWSLGMAYVEMGRHDLALALIEEFLAHPDADTMTPIDATHTYKALSDAREATGDAAGALDALRRSQSNCYVWVAGSVVSRLQAIEFSKSGRESLRSAGLERSVEAVNDALSDLTSREGGSLAAVPGDQESGAGYVEYLTHDMRNSLQGVMSMLSMLQLSDLDDQQRRFASLADASANTLLALCNDVLDLAQLSAGQMVLNPEPIDIRAAFGEVVEPISVACADRGVDVGLVVAASVPVSVIADPLRLKRVVLNLLANAVKYTSEGSITVGVDWADLGSGAGRLEVEVRDTGPGIAPEAVPGLFDEFAQVDPGADQAKGGSGLGLAIVSQLVNLMQGEVSVDSNLGEGSTFCFQIPVASALVPA